MGAGRRRAAAAADLKWSDALLSSLITLLKVWVPRPGRFSRGLLFQAPCKINQSFIKVHSRHELPNQIEQCFRPVSCYCSIKLSYCWGRWLKCSLPTKDVNVVCVKLEEKNHNFVPVKHSFLKDSVLSSGSFLFPSLPPECGKCFVLTKKTQHLQSSEGAVLFFFSKDIVTIEIMISLSLHVFIVVHS